MTRYEAALADPGLRREPGRLCPLDVEDYDDVAFTRD
jgi:hypothetical protein